MSLGVRSTAKKARKNRDATANSPRLLLLFSALMVMVFTRGAPVHASALAALVVAALATGSALLRPIAVPDLDRLRRVEHILTGAALLAGLTLTAGTVALVLADLASALWFALIAIYTILGLAGALLMVRRMPPLNSVFWLFLVAHAAVTIALLRSSPPHIDVAVFLRDGAVAVLHGHNPYSMTFPNIYPPALAELFYGHGVVVDRRITFGFPYLPVALLIAIPGQLLGDVRYSQLIAMVVTALVLRRLASDRVGRAAAVLGVAAPAAIPMLTGAWTEPTLVALLACLVLALEGRRYVFMAVFLGLFLVSKQYVVVAIPLIWLIRQSLTRRVIFISLGVATAVTLPFFLVGPTAFWKSIVEFQLIQPFRADSLSLLVSSVNTFGWPPPWTYGALPLVSGGLTAIALALRAPRTPAAFAAAIGLTLLVTILLSKQAFMNYYFLVSGAFLIAAVAWPLSPGPTPSESASSPPDAPP
jgi:hypothetical protein